MISKKSVLVPRGCVPVLVGTGEDCMERVVVHTEDLMHPCFVLLLELAAMEFGYHQEGILRIPCDMEHFRWILNTTIRATKAKNPLICCLLTLSGL